MFLLYPSAESETSHAHWPWLTLLVCVLAALHFAVILQPKQSAYQAQRQLLTAQIDNILSHASNDGRIKMDHYLQVQDDHSLLANPDYRDVFPENAVTAYADLQALQTPVAQLRNGSLFSQLGLLVAWPAWLWLVVVTLLLIPSGFLIEHLFSVIFTVPLLFICGVAALLGPDSVPEQLWPSVELAWVSFLLLWAWLPVMVCPWANVELSLKFWFTSNAFWSTDVPLFLFPTGLTAWLIFSPEAGDLYQLKVATLVGPLVLALLISLPLRILPHKSRAPKVGEVKGDEAKRGRVETLFSEERHSEAVQLMRELSVSAAEVDDHTWLAHTAWRHDLTDLAHLHFRKRLQLVAETGDVEKITPLVEEMIKRNVTIPPSILLQVFDYALARHKMRLAAKVLNSYTAHEKVSAGEALAATEQYAETLLMGEKPDKPSMVALKDWLEQHHPEHSMIQNIIKRLQAMAGETTLGNNYGNLKLHKHVEIDIHSITGNYVECRIKGRQDRQRIPWTAVSALYGYCVVSHTQGLYGCLVINFRNKLFACHFGRRNIFMSNSFGKPMSFESAWDVLFKESPEDIPRMEIEMFQQFIRPEDSEAAVEAFVAEKLLPSL